MAYEGVEETCGSSQGGLTDGTAVGREADKLFPEFLDGFVSTCILVGIFGLANIKKYSMRLERTVSSQAGQGRLSVNPNGHVISEFESGCDNNQCVLKSCFCLILDDERVCEACQVFTDDQDFLTTFFHDVST